MREPRYFKPASMMMQEPVINTMRKIALVVNDQHAIHHVRERGYVEAPVRISSILKAIEPLQLFERIDPAGFEDKWLKEVHGRKFLRYFRRVCEVIEPDVSVYPYVFPIRNHSRPPVELPVRAGYFCIDTFTPINRNAYVAARRAVDCTLTAARELLSGRNAAYALVRPPGHHAESSFFGGFCYFNNAAIAANYLSKFGKIAILDIDYHHGNGQQYIFYERKDVLTISIHGHPGFAYPYFSGFYHERGEGKGKGFNVNYPLPEAVTYEKYSGRLKLATARIQRFQPAYLVVCLGLDTARGDPTGTWPFRGKDFFTTGEHIGSLGLPMLIVQEGGYRTRSIGSNAAHFFSGLVQGISGRKRS
jgi:acetoin utilization deacetylase AcuC-like enzyme